MKKCLYAIILTGTLLRIYNLDIPILEFYPSRQVQTADITRNFILNDFNILNPTVSYLGPGFSPFLIEFPGYNFIVALFYKIFGINEIYGRLVSLIFWIISSVFLYKICLLLTSKSVGFFAVFLFTFSPLSVLVSRSFQPDQMMIAFSLASIYFALKYQGLNKTPLVTSAIFASIAFLTKAPAAIFTLIPVIFVLSKKNGSNFKRDGFIYLVIAILPSLMWYFYSFWQNSKGLITQSNFSFSNWFGIDVFLSLKYYSNIFGFEINLVLLPIGVLLFYLGIFNKDLKHRDVLYVWLFSIVLYFVLFNKHVMTHEYYHLPFLPIATIFAGISLNSILKGKTFLLKSLLLILIALLSFPQTFMRAYEPIPRFREVLNTAEKIKRHTQPNELIVGSMDAGPSLVYYSKRQGWGFEVDRENTIDTLTFYDSKQMTMDPISDLNERIEQGAVLFATAYKPQFIKNKTFSDYMYENFPILEESDSSVIFSLKERVR